MEFPAAVVSIAAARAFAEGATGQVRFAIMAFLAAAGCIVVVLAFAGAVMGQVRSVIMACRVAPVCFAAQVEFVDKLRVESIGMDIGFDQKYYNIVVNLFLMRYLFLYLS